MDNYCCYAEKKYCACQVFKLEFLEPFTMKLSIVQAKEHVDLLSTQITQVKNRNQRWHLEMDIANFLRNI